MQAIKAQKFAQNYIQLHLGNGWSFRWDLQPRRFASTQFRQQIITLSSPITLLNNETQVLDALRHEIAHARLGYAAHDESWALLCRSLGGSAKAKIDRSLIKLPQR